MKTEDVVKNSIQTPLGLFIQQDIAGLLFTDLFSPLDRDKQAGCFPLFPVFILS